MVHLEKLQKKNAFNTVDLEARGGRRKGENEKKGDRKEREERRISIWEINVFIVSTLK